MIKIFESESPRNNKYSNNLISMKFVLMREKVSSSVNADDIKFSFIVRDAAGNVAHEEVFAPCGSPEESQLVGSSALMRLFKLEGTDVVHNESVLFNGTLVIDVVIQALPKPTATHTLSNPFQRNMLHLFYSGERADVTFEFGHFRQSALRAHKLILETNAPVLARLCACDDNTSAATVHIRDTSVEAFRFVLKYIYGGPLPNQHDLLKYGKEIILAANRYSVAGLKLEIERSLISMRVVDTSNCVDFISFAHDNSCFLLKEYAISYFVARSGDFLNISGSLQRLHESPDLILDILRSTMKIQPHSETTSSPTKGKFKWWVLRSRKSEKKNGGKVVPAQPVLQKKAKNNTAGMELLGSDSIRKRAIKVLQLCEEHRTINQ